MKELAIIVALTAAIAALGAVAANLPLLGIDEANAALVGAILGAVIAYLKARLEAMQG
jgi:hypothetical protein